MKRSEIFTKPNLVLVLAATLALSINHANAERIFYDSFESPNNPSGGTDPDNWSAPGHPNYFSVANEGDGSNWSTPYGEQGIGTYSNGVGTRTITFLPSESGDFTVNFNITSRASKGEYRAELWAFPFFGLPILLGSAEGDTDGSKDMSFSDQIAWRYDYETVTLPGQLIDGARLEIRLGQDPNRGNWRNTPIWDNVSVDFIPDNDTSGPTVTEIVDDIGGGPVAPNTLINYTVTFSEDIDASTIDASDFGNAGSALVTIGTVTETSPESGIFIVQVTPTGDGTLRLRINENATIDDVGGNSMDTSSAVSDNITISVEGTLPLLRPRLIVDGKGGEPVTPDTLVTYTVTFSKDMDASTVTAADFDNAGSAPVMIGAVNETTPTSGVFTVEATPTGSGTLRLKVNSSAMLKDVPGNELDTSSAITDDTELKVDGIAPTLIPPFISDDKEGNPVTPNTLVTYTVFFSEDMDGSTIDAADFSNAGDAPFTISSVDEASSNVFRVELTPTGAGTLQLQINASAELEDEIGNALDTVSAIIDDTTIIVDSSIPALASTDIVDDQGGATVTPNTLVTYTVTFSKDMDATTVGANDFGNAGDAPFSIGAISETAAASGVFIVRATPTGSGTLKLRVNASAILKDEVGNSLNTASAIIDDTTIIVDGSTPALASTGIADDHGGGSVTPNTLVTYTVTFNKDMDSSTVTATDFGNAGDAPVTIVTVTETAATSGVFTVEVTPTGAGSLRLQVNALAILKDEIGNELDTALAIIDDTTLTVDGTAPTLASTGIADDQGGNPVSPNTLVTYTVTFSKDMDASTVEAADFGNAGDASVTFGAVSETAPTSGVFTVEVTPTAAGTLQLRVNASAVLKDLAGNELDTASAIIDDTTITVGGNPYGTWSGGTAAFDLDENDDGIPNGLAWLLGASDADENALQRLPGSVESSGNLVLSFRCLKTANRGGVLLKIQYSSDMGSTDAWSGNEAEVPDTNSTVNGIAFDTTDDGDFINVIATIPASAASPNNKLFARLAGELP